MHVSNGAILDTEEWEPRKFSNKANICIIQF
jgi:hypothetical protein